MSPWESQEPLQRYCPTVHSFRVLRQVSSTLCSNLRFPLASTNTVPHILSNLFTDMIMTCMSFVTTEIIICWIGHVLDHVSTVHTTYKFWICVFFRSCSFLLITRQWVIVTVVHRKGSHVFINHHFCFLHSGFVEAVDNDRAHSTNLLLKTAWPFRFWTWSSVLPAVCSSNRFPVGTWDCLIKDLCCSCCGYCCFPTCGALNLSLCN